RHHRQPARRAREPRADRGWRSRAVDGEEGGPPPGRCLRGRAGSLAMFESTHRDGPGTSTHGPSDSPPPGRVLVVDDEASVVEVFQEFLSTQGYELTMAG